MGLNKHYILTTRNGLYHGTQIIDVLLLEIERVGVIPPAQVRQWNLLHAKLYTPRGTRRIGYKRVIRALWAFRKGLGTVDHARTLLIEYTTRRGAVDRMYKTELRRIYG